MWLLFIVGFALLAGVATGHVKAGPKQVWESPLGKISLPAGYLASVFLMFLGVYL